MISIKGMNLNIDDWHGRLPACQRASPPRRRQLTGSTGCSAGNARFIVAQAARRGDLDLTTTGNPGNVSSVQQSTGRKHMSRQLSKVRGLMGGVALGLAIFSLNAVADDSHRSGSGFEGESSPSL